MIRGSEWHKWDLHIHSKYSKEESAKLSIKDIFENAIKNDISVISITDHTNFDALDEIWEYWETERISIHNKEEKVSDHIIFFPGIELKTDIGAKGVHIIAVFPNYIDGEKVNRSYMNTQFLAKINCTEINIKKNGDGNYIKGLFCTPVNFENTCKLVRELGGLIIIHAGSKHGSIENNMNHARKQEDYMELYNTLGEKKEEYIKNYIDICEISSMGKNEMTAKEFYLNTFKKPTIISSDSHNNYNGQKFTWIKSNKTFEGLKQILNEPKDRIFLGEKPPLFERFQNERTNFINEIFISNIDEYNGEGGIWFKDVKIHFNKELCAIIGNKGNGKSAIGDIVGLLGDSKNSDYFNFLNVKKFNKDKGKLSKNFYAKLNRNSEDIIEKNLYDEISTNNHEVVKYIPQNYFEKITNDLDESFENEIKNVIFSHIKDSEGIFNDFDDLIFKKTKNLNDNINLKKNDLFKLNKEIIKFEVKGEKDYLETIENKLKNKKEDLKALVEPEEIKKPTKTEKDIENEKQLEILNAELDNKEELITTKIEEIKKLRKEKLDIENIIEKMETFKIYAKNFIEENKADFEIYDLNINEIIKFEIKDEVLKGKLKRIDEEILKIDEILEEDEGEVELQSENLYYQKRIIKDKIKNISDLLGASTIKYQNYLSEKKQYEAKKMQIMGDNDTADTISYYEKEIKFIKTELNEEIILLRKKRLYKVKEIFEEKKKELDIYNSIKEAIDNFIEKNEDLLKEFEISLESSYKVKEEFYNEFFQYIDGGKKGSFKGNNKEMLKEAFSSKIESFNDVEKSLSYIIDSFLEDKREKYYGEEREISSQLIQGKQQNFYDYLFSIDYIIPSYSLKLDNKNLDELSPGEKGAPLLVFYLLLDKSTKPLIIDQPEDNLDNQSVFNILVPFIKKAKERRQIILITHNPNLAVVSDAEQIIWVNIDKANKNKFEIKTGAIEEKEINEKIVEILEGTEPAFKARDSKYIFKR